MMGMTRALAAVLIWIACVLPAASQVNTPVAQAQPQAQTQDEAVGQPSANDVQELLRILGDPRVVEWLKTRLADLPQPETANRSLRAEIEDRLKAARQRIAELGQAWSNFPYLPDVLAEAWRAQLERGAALRSLTYVIVFLFIGGGLEWLFWQYFHPILLRIEHTPPLTLAQRLRGAAARLLLQASGLLLFALGSIGAFLSFAWPPFLERIVVSVLLTVIGIRALAMLSRFVVAPRNGQLRLVPLETPMAARIHRWHLAVAIVFASAMMVSDTFAFLAQGPSGSPQAVNAALAIAVLLGAGATAAVIAMIWTLSRGIARDRAPPVAPTRRFETARLRVQPTVISVVVLVAYLLWVFDADELMWTVLVIGLFVPAARLTRVMANHFVDRAEQSARESGSAAQRADAAGPDDATPAEPEDGTGAEDASSARGPAQAEGERYAIYRPLIHRIARFALAGLALLVLAAAWNTNIAALSDSPRFAGRLVKIAIDIAAAALIADLVWGWAKTAIDRRMAGYVAPPPGDPPGPEARMATLLPLTRNILLITLIALVGLTALSSLGVNIAPLIAGAGILGVAIGFGAQSLVRDIVSGIFFLIDDAFRVGEYVEIGDLRGTVESMSLRSMRVRHHRGAVHTIPFGELKSLTNYSRDWVIMKLEFRVPFDTDLRLVKKLVKKVGAELQADENYGHYLIEPLKSQGVRRMEEFNMVVGVKFMAKPGAQWVIRRDAYQKLRDAFEANGINFAQRNVKVEVLSDRPLTAEEKEAVTGAAQDAIDPPRQQQPQPDEP
ncbi:MAG: mechanosensitive ion channel family protein [Nitratireductor sp.]